MTDQPSTSGDDYEETNWDDPQSLRWSRREDPNWPADWPKTIELDWIYDPVAEVYYPPGTPCNDDMAAFERHLDETIAEYRRTFRGPHLITRDELLAAGALNVSPAGRKLRGKKPDLETGLFKEEHFQDEEERG
ncbi:MAG: hypothetical protein WEB58_01910 [Planctomycetaceae bacterium]